MTAAVDLSGKTIVVTGASAGIGAAAARRLAALGATVAVVGRSPERTAAVAESIGARAHLADFARLDDVRALARELLASYERIDVLANNAGGLFTSRRTTADGHETTFQVNHLAPFLLTGLLLDRLAEAPEARVVSTGSMAYRAGRIELDDLDGERRRYSIAAAYAASKLATVLFTRELAHRTAGTGITATAFHPGAVATEVARDNPVTRRLMRTRLAKRLFATPDQGAEPLVHLAALADPHAVNGAYFHRLEREAPKNPQANDGELAKRLWERSEALTGISIGR
ncbi:SDR family NAD(P)-dependent oxidoreductase [Glycomyces arizonensis]|uniref:SDR family NAD(P)-dependent oxidoreductase n=1 Tax=Glycomyces arizonensis TaxID=256035 RepID=UPI00040F4034|nr:SDR family NAD(P)-dependent oxidoreductase [Glycomyces arizonensis]